MFSNSITLTDKDSKKLFSFEYSFSTINIQKIDVISLMGKKPDDWYIELSKMTLLFIYTDTADKTTSFPINLAAQTRLDQKNPIIEFREFIIPEENKNNMTSLGVYVKNLSIELKYRDTPAPPMEVIIYYQNTPGVR
jgi:hypothetical protein